MAPKPIVPSAGSRFGGWTVISGDPVSSGGRSRQAFVACRCKCGTERLVNSSRLRHGATVSCGCDRRRTHGLTETVEFGIWEKMHARCRRDPFYAGRGIRVCERWTGPSGFQSFLSDMGKRPSSDHQIDRIDNNGHYAPGNCRWVTRRENCSNTRRNVRVLLNGEQMVLAEAARRLNINYGTLRSRVRNGRQPGVTVLA